jgi:enoyl-CoA hydratase/carnithine racemase
VTVDAVEDPREDEGHVTQAVQINSRVFGNLFSLRCVHERTLGSTTDRAHKVRVRGRTRATRQNEILKHRQIGVQAFGERFESLDVRILNCEIAGNREFASQIKEIVLDIGERLPKLGRNFFGKQKPDDAIQLIDIAHCSDARMTFCNARTVAKARGARVAGFRCNLRESMAHTEIGSQMTEDRSLDESLVLRDVSVGVATVTLNSPSNFNALSSVMIAALHAALDEIGSRDDVRVVVIAAKGKAFCAGHDLREMRALEDEAWHRALFDRCSAMMMAIEALRQPVIAKVHGIATAAGCQLVAACDLAIASSEAKFATSGIKLGLFCSTPAVAVTRNVSAKHYAELLFTGEFIDASIAERIGLINRAVAADALEREVRALAEKIASQSLASLASGKRLLRELRAATDANERYRLAAANMARDMQSKDARAGIDAFLSKSERPDWVHR